MLNVDVFDIAVTLKLSVSTLTENY